MFNTLVIVGAGKIAWDSDKHQMRDHYSAARAVGYKSIIFVEPNCERRKQTASYTGESVIGNLDDIPCDKPIDVVIANPDNFHYETFLKLQDKPINRLIIEKPIAMNKTEALEILEKSHHMKAYIQVNYFRRYLPEFVDIKSKLKNQKYGDVTLIRGIYGKGLFHNGSHLINLITDWVGKIKPEKLLNIVYDYHDEDPSIGFYGVIENTSIPVNISVINQNEYTVFELEIYCENALIKIDAFGRQIIISHKVKSERLVGYYELIEDEVIVSDFYNSGFHSMKALVDMSDAQGLLDAVNTIICCESVRSLL